MVLYMKSPIYVSQHYDICVNGCINPHKIRLMKNENSFDQMFAVNKKEEAAARQSEQNSDSCTVAVIDTQEDGSNLGQLFLIFIRLQNREICRR